MKKSYLYFSFLQSAYSILSFCQRETRGAILHFCQGKEVDPILPFGKEEIKGEILPFLTKRYRSFATKKQGIQYWPFPKEGKGNTALLSRKDGGTILLFFQAGIRGQYWPFPRSDKGAILPICQE